MTIIVINTECVKKTRHRKFWRRTCPPYEPVREDFMLVFAVRFSPFTVRRVSSSLALPNLKLHTRASKGVRKFTFTKYDGNYKQNIWMYPARRWKGTWHLAKLSALPRDNYRSIPFSWLHLMMMQCNHNRDIFGKECLSAHFVVFIVSGVCIVSRRRCPSVRCASVSVAVGSPLCCHCLNCEQCARAPQW